MLVSIDLPTSKSISNRLLIIRALCPGGFNIHQLSEAEDTQQLNACLQEKGTQISVGEGGTTLRFLLAYFCLKGQLKKLEGEGNLPKRPLIPLLQIMEQMGARFLLPTNGGFLPLQILKGIDVEFSETVTVDARLSSQFVSAILLISPQLKRGLKLCWTAGGVSEPYIQMTIRLMRLHGIKIDEVGDHAVQVYPGPYLSKEITVEADWSGASYFLAWLALKKHGQLFFPGLTCSGFQADEKAMVFFKQFGLQFTEQPEGMLVTLDQFRKPEEIHFDFTQCPDLFPAIIIFCAIARCDAHFSGLQHLDHKESKRLTVMETFLNKANVNTKRIVENENHVSMSFFMKTFSFIPDGPLDSYRDHRIAMAFSLLNILTPVSILYPECVNKSFPGYWLQMAKLQNHSVE